MNIVNSLWTEKYRPNNLNNLILKEDYKKELNRYINNKDIPNLLFEGTPGTGKSTIARVLTDKNIGIITNNQYNLLILNASGQESRGIGIVNDVIEPFLKIPPSGRDNIKIVYLEEMDQLTIQAQKALRFPIEKYSSTSRFIGTCNYLHQIEEALISRFTIYTFDQLPLQDVIHLTEEILEKEKIEYQIEDLKYIIDSFYPDIRKIIGVLQDKSIDYKLIVNRGENLNKEKYLETLIIEIMNSITMNKKNKNQELINLVNKNMEEIIKIVESTRVNYRSTYINLFSNKNTFLPVKAIINRYTNTHNTSLVPSMNFLAMLSEIITCLNKY